jgi:hypothetical protein
MVRDHGIVPGAAAKMLALFGSRTAVARPLAGNAIRRVTVEATLCFAN